jgi:hypothetical protein
MSRRVVIKRPATELSRFFNRPCASDRQSQLNKTVGPASQRALHFSMLSIDQAGKFSRVSEGFYCLVLAILPIDDEVTPAFGANYSTAIEFGYGNPFRMLKGLNMQKRQ